MAEGVNETGEEKKPHRSIQMAPHEETKQILKYDTDEIFSSDGWKELEFAEAQQAFKEKRTLFGLYDPMETVYSRGNDRTSTRIVVKLSGRNRPDDFNHFKTIKYYEEEVK